MPVDSIFSYSMTVQVHECNAKGDKLALLGTSSINLSPLGTYRLIRTRGAIAVGGMTEITSKGSILVRHSFGKFFVDSFPNKLDEDDGDDDFKVMYFHPFL